MFWANPLINRTAYALQPPVIAYVMPHMDKLFLTLILFFALTVARASPNIGPLPQSILSGACSCNFQFPEKTSMAGETFLEWVEGEEASMWIDGKPVKLKVDLVGSQIKKRGVLSRGDVEYYALTNQSFRVKVKCTVTQVCDPKISECESTGYKAKVVVSSPQGETSLSATGACGC